LLNKSTLKNNKTPSIPILGIRELGVAGLILLLLFIAFLFEPRILSPMSLRNMLQWFPIIAIVAMGEMMIIITRGIDVSVGSNLCFAGLAAGIILRDNPGFNPYHGIIVSILIGACLGLLNGIIIAFLKIPSIVVTLAGLSAYRGMAFLLANGSEVSAHQIPKTIMNISRIGPLNQSLFTYLFVLMLFIGLITYIILNHTRIGRNVYVYGSNPDAALIRGIPIKKIILFMYTYTGALAGLAGILYMSRFGFVNPGQTGVNFEMMVISAVVIGGVSVYGGAGNIFGVLLGSFFLGVINISLSTLGLPHLWQDAIYGFIIIFTVIIDTLIKKFEDAK